MSRKRFATYLVAASIAFAFGACGGGGGDPITNEGCVECLAGAGAAVWCIYPSGSITGFCGADANLAAFHCIESGGSWSLAEICYDPPEGETGGPDEPWDPDRDVTIDHSSGDFIIDELALDELKRNPGLLFSDSSTLEELKDGYFTLAASGPLSEALGWEVGDVLLDINGYDLDSAAAFADAYPDLSVSKKFELTIDRDERAVVLRYRVQ